MREKEPFAWASAWGLRADGKSLAKQLVFRGLLACKRVFGIGLMDLDLGLNMTKIDEIRLLLGQIWAYKMGLKNGNKSTI